MPDAHSATRHLTVVDCFPQHEARKSDPHYAAFNACRRRLKALGKLQCWINNADCDTTRPIELHHSLIEFSLANIVDTAQFAELYPEFHIASDADFLAWIEGEGNLLPLCVAHHRGTLGIHSILYSPWLVQRFMKAGVAAPERAVIGKPVPATA